MQSTSQICFHTLGKKTDKYHDELSEQSDLEKSEMLSIYASNTCYNVIMWLAHAQLYIKKACLSSTDLIKQQIDIKLRHTNKQLC